MTESESRVLLLDVANWPRWPLLPMKKYNSAQPGEFPIMGMINADDEVNEEDRITVYIDNIFSDRESGGETMRYINVDAMLADGWVVD